MKTFLIAIIAIIVVAPPCRAQVEDLIPEVPRELEPESHKKNLVYDAVAIGGLGIANNTDHIYRYAPTMAIGLEIPFSISHSFAFQAYGHFWVDDEIEMRNYFGEYDDINQLFVKIGGSYCQYGISASLVAYLMPKHWKTRISLNIGALLFSPKNQYKSFDFGATIYYRLNESLALSFNLREYYFPRFTMGNGPTAASTTPLLFVFNCNYYFKW